MQIKPLYSFTTSLRPYHLICVLYTYETPSGEKEVKMSLLWFKTRLHFTQQPTISIRFDFDENVSTRLVVAELETNRNNSKQNNILCSEKSVLTALDHSL